MIFFGLEHIVTYIFLVIVAFLGLPIGLSLAGFAPDEAHKYRSYFIPLQLFFIILFFTVAIVFFPLFVSLSMIILSFSFLFLFWRKMNHNVLDYIVFSVLFLLFSLSTTSLMYASFVVFLFGLVSGFLYFVLHTKDPLSKKKYSVNIHKHSGKHLSFEKMFSNLLRQYLFFPLIALIVFLMGQIAHAVLV
jgi:hypothetical protein